MDIKTINKLAEIMVRHDLTELSLDQNQVKLHLCRASGHQATAHGSSVNEPATAVAAAVVKTPSGSEEIVQATVSASVATITSPLVGTFYAAPTPEALPFVSPGSKVKAGDVLCIVEAMKVMNEIKAEQDCVIEKVLVKNGMPVEFGQVLFEITE